MPRQVAVVAEEGYMHATTRVRANTGRSSGASSHLPDSLHQSVQIPPICCLHAPFNKEARAHTKHIKGSRSVGLAVDLQLPPTYDYHKRHVYDQTTARFAT